MFRFTIRDVLWLTVVVAMGVAWWMDRTKSNQERAQTQANLQELRQMLGGEKRLDDLIAWAKRSNQTPTNINTLIIHVPSGSKPATTPTPSKVQKSN